MNANSPFNLIILNFFDVTKTFHISI